MAASIATTTMEVGFLPKTLLSGGGGSFSLSIPIQASPKSNINTMVVVSEKKKKRSSFVQTSAVRHLVGCLTKSEGLHFAVVRGDTTHYDAVANSAASGVLSAGLSSGVPCIFGVLTCDNMDPVNFQNPFSVWVKVFKINSTMDNLAELTVFPNSRLFLLVLLLLNGNNVLIGWVSEPSNLV